MDNQAVKIGPISKDLLYLKIADAIFAYAKANHLKEGDKLPSERDMAAMFQTGRNSVREALRVLENRGVIEVKTGRGAYLRESTENVNSIYFRLFKCDFLDLTELETTLEDRMLHKALSAPEEQKRELLRLGHDLMALAESGIYDDGLDHQFHAKLLEMGRNPTIAQIVTQLRVDVFKRYWAQLNEDSTCWLETVPQHLTLARAVLANNEPRALEALHEIHEHTVRMLEQIIDKG